VLGELDPMEELDRAFERERPRRRQRGRRHADGGDASCAAGRPTDVDDKQTRKTREMRDREEARATHLISLQRYSELVVRELLGDGASHHIESRGDHSGLGSCWVGPFGCSANALDRSWDVAVPEDGGLES
jgi:hypothetical protein